MGHSKLNETSVTVESGDVELDVYQINDAIVFRTFGEIYDNAIGIRNVEDAKAIRDVIDHWINRERQS